MDNSTIGYIIGYIYILTSPHKLTNDRRKIGLTMLPHHRLNTYLTGCCDLDVSYFEKLYQVRVKSIAELRDIELRVHSCVAAHRRCREWFELESTEPIDTFMHALPCFVCECNLDNISDLQKSNDVVTMLLELELQGQPNEPTPNEPTPRKAIPTPVCDPCEDYFEHMLPPGQAPRRIQRELFNAFQAITMTDCPYNGVVMWPTAVGKTIGMLSLFFISFLRRSSQGKTWRGLLIAPQNDILNTIIAPIKKLELWGIVVIWAHDAQFTDAMRKCPTDKHVLIVTTHAALTDRKKWSMLPEIHHCHYDEVQQSTGLQFFGLLMEWRPTFTYFTGTSATPKTCNSDQHTRLHQLFGTPLPILHRCDMDEAVREGWIAKPRIAAHLVSHDTRISEFVGIISQIVEKKRADGKWMYGKVIVYLDTIADVHNAVRCALALNHFKTTATIYMAVKVKCEEPEPRTDSGDDELDESECTMVVDGAKNDSQFIADTADGSLRILFACHRYRQGSDIFGIEMTGVLYGSTIAINVLLQIAGRALRKDVGYCDKEGWCVIVKTRNPNDTTTNEDDVMTSLIIELAKFALVTSGSAHLNKQKIREIVMTFLIPLRFDNGKDYNIEETVERMQCMYLRQEFASGNKCLREYCNEKGIDSKFDYEELRKKESDISLPSEIPCRHDETIFMFFHPHDHHRIDKCDFVELLRTRKLHTSQIYESWRMEQHDVKYPSIQHIADGYFGVNETNFNALFETKRTMRR